MYVVAFAAFQRTVIVKRPILRRSRRQLFRCDEAFNNEIAAFTRLVPDLMAFAQHKAIDVDARYRTTTEDDAAESILPIPRCLFAGCDAAGELIVLEDLRAGGFRMVDRLQGLDFAHARLVMQVCIVNRVC